jgi:hypothetical protein
VDFSQVRRENNQQLAGKVEQIRSAKAQSVLEPFARAYLGMFYEIDNHLDCDERVELLASPEIANAVLQGFETTVINQAPATPAEIGEELAAGKELAEGYVILAGMDRLDRQNRLSEVSDATLRSALCFTYSNNIPHQHQWQDALLDNDQIAIPALADFWAALIKQDAHLLPGLKKHLLEDQREPYIKQLVLTVLQNWQTCRLKIFKPLLQQALFHADHQQLLVIARQKIDQEKLADENQRVLWLAAAFLISPDVFEQPLAGYIGRVKQKVLPLLDFVIETLRSTQAQTVISARAIAQLLRVIAPIFPPQFHVYGSEKVLDVNSQNVMFLFHQLARYPAEEKRPALDMLRKARVMKIYKKVIDHCSQLDGENIDPSCFRDFLRYLIDKELVVEKSNRFDSSH